MVISLYATPKILVGAAGISYILSLWSSLILVEKCKYIFKSVVYSDLPITDLFFSQGRRRPNLFNTEYLGTYYYTKLYLPAVVIILKKLKINLLIFN